MCISISHIFSAQFIWYNIAAQLILILDTKLFNIKQLIIVLVLAYEHIVIQIKNITDIMIFKSYR